MDTTDTGKIVDKIVHEVKSQGVFDLFRKDSMADVDTKPSYQNLRQRVENAVKKFLSEQKWTPETNKNQLRERLRKHIAESGFLSVGVDRIVDQVVDPKIATVFKPKIEEIAYKCLGVPQPPRDIIYEPPPPLLHPFPPLPPPMNGPPPLHVETVGNSSLLPTDLEQVSPDSDKATERSDFKEEVEDMDIDDDMDEVDDFKVDDDDESPPFEPILKCNSPKKEITAEDSQPKVDMAAPCSPKVATSAPFVSPVKADSPSNEKNGATVENDAAGKTEVSLIVRTPEGDSEKEASCSFDAAASQESQLSQVSSDSRISFASHEFIANSDQPKSQELENVAVNISEEAQMPKFSENSCEDNTELNVSQLHFDIKKDEIKFEGTERKGGILDVTQKDSFDAESSEINATNTTQRHEDTEAEKGGISNVAPRQENSFLSSLEDTDSAQLCIAEKSINESTAPSENKTLLTSTVSSSELAADVSPPQRSQKERHLSTSSSSRSQHRKHSSKGRHHQSNEKESSKHRDRERTRNGERHSRSKISSRSSKHSSSSHKHSNASTTKNQKEPAAKSSISSSSCSSSSRSDSVKSERKERCDSDKKHSSSSTREKSSSGGSDSLKKSEPKVPLHDDHNEPKEKLNRRTSTDSNDEDKGSGANGAGAPRSTSPCTVVKESNKGNDNSNESETKESNGQNIQGAQHRNKVVLLNDILQNPLTEFIELEASSTVNNLQIVCSAPQTQPAKENEANSDGNKQNSSFTRSPMPIKTATVDKQADALLPIANAILIDQPDKVVYSPLLLELAEEEGACKHTEEEFSSSSVKHEKKRKAKEENVPRRTSLYLEQPIKAIDDEISIQNDLLFFNDDDDQFKDRISEINKSIQMVLDAMQSVAVDMEQSDKVTSASFTENPIECSTALDASAPKRIKITAKTSPTPSETSVNSKENEIFDKNLSVDSKNMRTERRNNNNKVSQQRYASEDLYKPRTVLSHRSRRRGFDSMI